MAFRTPNKSAPRQGHVADRRTATPASAPATDTVATPHKYSLRPRKESRGSITPSRRRSNSKRANVTGGPGLLDSSTSKSDQSSGSTYAHDAHDAHDAHGLAPHPDDGGQRRQPLGSASQLSGMASSAAKWREEQILIVCPGSLTTMAQLGCSELTPPTHRFPTRMFRDGDEWRPYHTFKRTRIVGGVEHDEWVEDVDSAEGAVFPIEGGRIVQMQAFLAFLDHVHGMLTTTYHNTPIMLMASPQWTRPDCEAIAQYVFEKTRTPALCMLHSALATQYGLKWPNMTVVDIGYEKVDVTAIHDGRVVNHMDLGSPNPDRHISGGEVFTQRLAKLLRGKGFNRDMAEQLKKSAICEVLPYAPGERALVELPKESTVSLPPAAAPVAAEAPKAAEPPRPSGVAGDDDDEYAEANGDDDGVLDVAAIVTSGQTKEFLAKREKEKEKGKPGRKPKDKEGDAAPVRPARLPNSKRTHNTFFYEEVVLEEVPREPKPAVTGPTNGAAGASAEKPAGEQQQQPPAQNGTAAESSTTAPQADSLMSAGESDAVPKPEEEKPAGADDTPEFRPKRIRRDVEVGLERFAFADRAEVDRIATTIYRTIQGIDDMYMRPSCWDNLVFVGNGARLRGLRDNIVQTLNARHLISPSTATIFTSELPSNMATPTGTGSQTPTGSFTGVPHQLSSSGVNPLLQAATTASTLGAGAVAGAMASGNNNNTGTPAA
ncbi:Actin-like protein ARP9, partial [Tolypocladium capitatum]